MRCPGLTTTPAGNLAVKSAAGVCAVVSPLMAIRRSNWYGPNG
jgi:hypothetical protein